MPVDQEKAKEVLGGFFDRIDKLVNEDGFATLDELSKVFGEHAAEFIENCDGFNNMEKEGKLSKEEFVQGILNDVNKNGLSQETFDEDWAGRMDAAVKMAEDAKPAEPAAEPAAEEPAAE